MSILVICNNKDPEPWCVSLQKKLPDVSISIFPEIKNKDSVEFAICWKPENNVLRKFPNIKAIQSLGASVEHIFETNLIDTKIQVSRIVDPQLSVDMFEFLLAITLNQLKNLHIYNNQNSEKIWEQHSYQSIKSTTVSILGLGKIGAHVASNFLRTGFIVQGWALPEIDIPEVKIFSGKGGLKNMMAVTDVLINILPLTNETRGILNKNNLQNLKKGAFLINVGRGPHLVNEDLVYLLNNNHISGASIDVFDEEPLPLDHMFWNNPKIHITPHVASLTNINTAVDQIVQNYIRLKESKPLLNLVSHEKGF